MKFQFRFLVLVTFLFIATNFIAATLGDSNFSELPITDLPTITSFTPTSGAIGTSVTITGTNFSTIPKDNIVYFGAVRAMVTSATLTSLIVNVPTGATYQPITVTVNGLTAYSSRPFIVTFSGEKIIDINTFPLKVDFTLGMWPEGVAIGDMDGDGKPDLVITNTGSATVSVLRNTSSSGSITLGSFAEKVDFITGMWPEGVAFGDMDGDGRPDLVVTSTGSGIVSVFRNISTLGSIKFADRVDFLTGSYPSGIAIGDIDGDGKPDFVVSNYLDGKISVFRNVSIPGSITESSFEKKVDFVAGQYPLNVTICDIDGDGKRDLVDIGGPSNTVFVLRNTSAPGSITFSAKVDFTTGADAIGVAVGDIDGDGKPDLIVCNYEGANVSVLRNTSTSGTITFSTNVDFETGQQPHNISIGDIDGDGKLDLVVSNVHNGTVSVLRNTSISGSITSASFAAKVDLLTGANPIGNAIGDIDGDGKPDLVVCNANSFTVSILRNNLTIIENLIAATAGQNGSISPSGLVHVNQGGNASFTISPNINYHIEDVLVDGVSVGAVSSYLFSNVIASHNIEATFAPDPGTISGTILVGTSRLANVNVNLLDNQMIPLADMMTGPNGEYMFFNLSPGTYYIMIVEPLGYAPDSNPKETVINPGGTYKVDFTLTPVTITNAGRGMGYWKQQFDKYITKKGNAQETETQLNEYVARVHKYYTPHFNVFIGLTTFPNWQAVLSPSNNLSMLNKAKQHLAALVLNLVSLKIGQGVIVTTDGRTASDVLTYVSTLITGNDPSKYELAKNLAEQVCNQQLVAAGLVPASNVLYKNVSEQPINLGFDLPKEFSLLQNFPNPFNPTTLISFSIPQTSFVTLKIYDVIGSEIATLINENKQAGSYVKTFDATSLPSGIYFYRIQAGNFIDIKKMIMIK